MDFLEFELNQQIAKVTLNRPDVFNSFCRGMALELQQVLKAAAEDESIRAVLLTGAGKAFCAGQDLKEMTGEKAPSFNTVLNEHFNPIIRLMRELEKPIIAAVNGVAAGAGANIALAADLTIAAESAVFIQAFSKIGLIPDSGGTYFLPRLIGWQRATALMMLGDKISAKAAADMGMIYAVFPDDTFLDEAEQLASRLSKMPTRALGLTKRALNYSLNNDLDKQLAIELELQATAGRSADYQEGVQAFLEKRKPLFTGK